MPIKPPMPRYARHPFEMCGMAGFMLWSASLVAVGPANSAAAKAIGDPSLQWMAVAITLGAISVVVSAWFKDVIIAGFMELGGLFGVLGPVAIYLFSIIQYTGNWSSGLASAALVAQSAACVWRAVQIVKWIRWIYSDHPPEVWDRMHLRDELDARLDEPPEEDQT